MLEFKRYEIDTTLKTLADNGTIRKICRGICVHLKTDPVPLPRREVLLSMGSPHKLPTN